VLHVRLRVRRELQPALALQNRMLAVANPSGEPLTDLQITNQFGGRTAADAVTDLQRAAEQLGVALQQAVVSAAKAAAKEAAAAADASRSSKDVPPEPTDSAPTDSATAAEQLALFSHPTASTSMVQRAVCARVAATVAAELLEQLAQIPIGPTPPRAKGELIAAVQAARSAAQAAERDAVSVCR
jgi:hypothetical protein